MSDSTTNHGTAPAPFVVGVDLGGTKIHAGLANAEGSILAERTVPTNRLGVGVATQITELVRQLGQDACVEAEVIAATGIGGAGVPDFGQNGFSRAPNLDLMGGNDFKGTLSHALGHPVVLENDVNVAALGELHYGIGQQHRDFVCISIGTGIGMGIVLDGRLVRGAHGAAGEIGYLPFGADPFNPGNRRRGPLEEVLAGDSMAKRYSEATGRVASAETIFDRALSGDQDALNSIDVEARWLAHAIVAVNAVLDTEAVVLTGGIGGRPELVARTTHWLGSLGLSDLTVLQSSLGQNGPIAGAVWLALDAINCESKGNAR